MLVSIARTLVFALGLALGSSGCGVGDPPVAPSPEPPVEPIPSIAPEPAPSAPDLACADHRECTLALDACGAPHARRVAAPDPPAAPDPCPPVGYAPVEPACESGVCIARRVELPELRTCAVDDDCVPIVWSCGGWWAVSRSRLADARAHATEVASKRLCSATERSPEPPVACLANVCVTR